MTAVPETLKQVKPYITLAEQLDQKGDRLAGYYCRLYAMQTGMNINKSAPDCKKFLLSLMDTLEKCKTALKNDESMKDESVAQATMEKYVLNLFKKADDDDRASRFSRNLIKQFYTAGLLFDVLNTFGELSEDLVGMKKYAKAKAMYLKKCFDNNEAPIPGPLITDDNSNFPADTPSNHENQHPNVPQNTYVEQPSIPKATASSSSPAYHAETTSPKSVGADAMLQAQKYCKFATSALQYEDVPTAIDNLEKCLKLLKTGK